MAAACGVFALVHGQDASWDFRNYHWYIPFAFLNGRLFFDVLPAEEATYYNPLLHLPYYWLAKYVSVRAAVFMSGVFGGLSILPLHLLARGIVQPAHRRWLVPILGLAGVTGATALSLLGSTQYDNALCVFALLGLAVAVGTRDTLRRGGPAAWWSAGLAGFLVACAIGLKLSFIVFGAGIAAALLAAGGTPRGRIERLIACSAGGALGVMLTGGFWFVTMYALTGNPVFPLFNDIFASPLLRGSTFSETEFVPHSLWTALAFPVLFAIDDHIAGYDAFDGTRAAVTYVLLAATAILFAIRRTAREPLVPNEPALMLFAFAGATYLPWLALLAQYRYIVGLEMLAPLLIWAAAGLMPLPVRWRMGLAAGLILATALACRTYGENEKVPFSRPYVQVELPAFPHPERTLIVIAGTREPTAYLIPSLPPGIPVIRIAGTVRDRSTGGTLWPAIAARIGSFDGDIYLLIGEIDRAEGLRAAGQYGLALDEGGCARFGTNLAGPYLFCRLRKA